MKNVKFGFTLIELIVVIAIIAVLATMTMPYSINYMNGIRHNREKDELVSLIRKAQSFAIDSKNNETWGICYDNGVIRLYSGSCSAYSYKNELTLSNATTVSGLSDIQFNNRTGEPSSDFSITIQTGSFSDTISMNSIGGMQIVSN